MVVGFFCEEGNLWITKKYQQTLGVTSTGASQSFYAINL